MITETNTVLWRGIFAAAALEVLFIMNVAVIVWVMKTVGWI